MGTRRSGLPVKGMAGGGVGSWVHPSSLDDAWWDVMGEGERDEEALPRVSLSLTGRARKLDLSPLLPRQRPS